jgi:uncharacterized membrane protein YgcG
MGPEKKLSKTVNLKKQNVPLRVHHSTGSGTQNSSAGSSSTNSPNPGSSGGGVWNLQTMKQK